MYIVSKYPFWLLESKHEEILNPVDNGHSCSGTNSHRTQTFATGLELGFATSFRGHIRCRTIFWWYNKISIDKATTNAAEFISGDRPGEGIFCNSPRNRLGIARLKSAFHTTAQILSVGMTQNYPNTELLETIYYN